MTAFQVGLCFAICGVSSLASAQLSPIDDFVLAGETAYGMLGPDTVAGNQVSMLEWSNDGKYLLALRKDLGPAPFLEGLFTARQEQADPGEQSIVIYSLQTRKQLAVWHGKATVREVLWFNSADRAVAIIDFPQRTTDPNQPTMTRESALLFDARTGSSQVIYSVDQQDSGPLIDIETSPSKPLGLLMLRKFVMEPGKTGDAAHGTWSFQFRGVNADGVLSAPLGVESAAGFSGWLDDGATPVVLRFIRAGGKVSRDYQAVNLISGRITPVTKPKMFSAAAPALPISVSNGAGVLTIRSHQKRAHSWWLVNESEAEPQVPTAGSSGTPATSPQHADGPNAQSLISSDAALVSLSPTLSGVAYVSQGVAFVRPLVQVPKDSFLMALKAAERMAMLSNTKQIGLGLIMFAADNDDSLPGSQSDIGNLIDPYLKNPDLMNGFTYTFAGGLLSDIKDPANTVIGYMSGAGGKVVLYSDGHVKWQNDQ